MKSGMKSGMKSRMKSRMKSGRGLVSVVLGLLVFAVAAEGREDPGTGNVGRDTAVDTPAVQEQEEKSGALQRVKELYDRKKISRRINELYEQAKRSGEKVPATVSEWVKEDLKKIGTWEYKTVVLESRDTAGAEQRLNELGQERWECFWMERGDVGVTCFLKRPGRSVLRRTGLPLWQLTRLFTGGDGGDAGE